MLKINTAVCGIPDAGQAFAMLMFGLHIKHCGMTQCDIDPSIYSKYEVDKDGKVKDYLIVITWTDDVRYFGTQRFIDLYEKNVQEHIKCKMLGVSKEFVSIAMKHDIAAGTLELNQPDYWVAAVQRFRDYLPSIGPKKRSTPLSISDAALLVEATDEEVNK